MFDKLKQDANVKKWTIAAKFGDVQAMCELGHYYWTQNLDYTSFTWYKKAADKGHRGAQDIVGGSYYYGMCGANQNLAEAVRYFRMASENGILASQEMLGVCYYYGFGVERDYKEAVRWLLKSIENSEIDDRVFHTSYYLLGECYLNGYGVAKDVNTAIAYYHKVLSTDAIEIDDNLPFYDSRKFNLTSASRNRLRSLGYNV